MWKFLLRSKRSFMCYTCLLRNYHNLSTNMSCTKILHFSSNFCLKRNLRYYRRVVSNDIILSSSFAQNIGLQFFFSSDSKNSNSEHILNKTQSDIQKKGKKQFKTYITLLGTDNSLTITTMEEANKIAKRRNLQIVKESDFDPKSGRAVYRLLTESQLVENDKEWDLAKPKKEKAIIGHKVIHLKSNIHENDVITKAKSMKKWLKKKLEVRVIISGDSTCGENVYKMIEKEIGTDGRILQKRNKNEDVRFQIVPPKENKNEKDSE